MNYCFSLDDERYEGNFDSRINAIKAGIKKSKELGSNIEKIYTALVRMVVDKDVSKWVPESKSILRQMKNRLFHDVGVRDWLVDIPQEKQAELGKNIKQLISKWIKKNDLLPCYPSVTNVETHPVN